MVPKISVRSDGNISIGATSNFISGMDEYVQHCVRNLWLDQKRLSLNFEEQSYNL